MKKGKVTGIGGVFFKCKHPNATKEWYSKNLHFKTDQYGSLFEFTKLMLHPKKGISSGARWMIRQTTSIPLNNRL